MTINLIAELNDQRRRNTTKHLMRLRYFT